MGEIRTFAVWFPTAPPALPKFRVAGCASGTVSARVKPADARQRETGCFAIARRLGVRGVARRSSGTSLRP